MLILYDLVPGQSVYRDPTFGTEGVDRIVIINKEKDGQLWEIELLPNGRIGIVGFSAEG